MAPSGARKLQAVPPRGPHVVSGLAAAATCRCSCCVCGRRCSLSSQHCSKLRLHATFGYTAIPACSKIKAATLQSSRLDLRTSFAAGFVEEDRLLLFPVDEVGALAGVFLLSCVEWCAWCGVVWPCS